MEIRLFTSILGDRSLHNFRKMSHKYGRRNFSEFIDTLMNSLYCPLPIKDFDGSNAVYLPARVNLTVQNSRNLLSSLPDQKYSLAAMEDEIISTLQIEQIDSSRSSVQRILRGQFPERDDDYKAYGIKKGLDFIADISNVITESNLHQLYMISAGQYVDPENRLQDGHFYRHDEVFIVGQQAEHQGLHPALLDEWMAACIDYINRDDGFDQVLKSIIIHYYMAYLHPYFDGNGRMARLMQMWYLVQNGYPAVMHLAFSAHISSSKNRYYQAFSQIADNRKVASVLDVTPFINYFIADVLEPVSRHTDTADLLNAFSVLMSKGLVSPKEQALFEHVLTAYGNREFSTKQLEKDFGNAAYATIRSFVMKFEGYGLLEKRSYGPRNRYRLGLHK